MDDVITILLIEDDEDDYIMTRDLLAEIQGVRHRLMWVSRYNAAVEEIYNDNHDVYLVDYRIGEHTGLELLRVITEHGCRAPVIMLTGQDDKEIDMEAMKAGASDYLVKGHINSQLLERSIRYAIERKRSEIDLFKAYAQLKATQTQMLQREKMASIGQLAAGVAHEINNPIGFVLSNLGTLNKYVNKLTEFIDTQSRAVALLNSPETTEKLTKKRKQLKLDYILEDVEALIKESLDGVDRVKKIVQNLMSFSRVEQTEYELADINECIESALNIVWNELKYKTTIEKEYGAIPLTRCYPHQLNQVFMNLLVNAAQAMEKKGRIKIRTWNGADFIHVSISDTGQGIPEDRMNRIFEPFFTTKDVGKGTGLGLSISYDIIKKHNGEITVQSEVGRGTKFIIALPVKEAEEDRA